MHIKNRRACTGLSAAFFILTLVTSTVTAQDGTDIPLPQSPQKAPEVVLPEAKFSVTRVPDEEIASLLKGIYSRVEDFKQISVSVEQGVVALTGVVRNLDVRQKAQNIAERFEGVFYVSNKLTIETRVQNRIISLSRRVNTLFEQFLAFLPTLVLALFTVATFWFFAVLVTRAKFLYKPFRPIRGYLIQSLLKIFLILVGFILAINILDITAVVGAVAGIAGILSIAFGFAFKDIVLNYLAGFLLSFRSPFKVTDLVKIDDYEGRVVRLTARELVLLTLDGNHIMIPNSQVYRATIINYTRNPRRRLEFTVVLDQKQDFTRAAAVGVEALKTIPGIITDPGPFMWIDHIEEQTVVVRFLGWLDQRSADWFKAKSEAMRRVKTALTAAGMETSEQKLLVYLFQGSEADSTPERVSDADTSTGLDIRGDVSPDEEIARQVQHELENDNEQNLLRKSN